MARRCAEKMYAADRASQHLGIEITDVAPGRARARMTVAATMVNGHGIVHGGYVFLLADTAFAFACNTYDVPTVAAAADVVFVAPAQEGDELTAEAVERLRYGRSGVYDVTVRKRRRRSRRRVPRQQPYAPAGGPVNPRREAWDLLGRRVRRTGAGALTARRHDAALVRRRPHRRAVRHQARHARRRPRPQLGRPGTRAARSGRLLRGTLARRLAPPRAAAPRVHRHAPRSCTRWPSTSSPSRATPTTGRSGCASPATASARRSSAPAARSASRARGSSSTASRTPRRRWARPPRSPAYASGCRRTSTHPSTPAAPDTHLPVNQAAADALGAWFGFAWSVLEQIRFDARAHGAPAAYSCGRSTSTPPSTSATRRTRGLFGASPGDDAHREPYLYVSPWQSRTGGVLERPRSSAAHPCRTRRCSARTTSAAPRSPSSSAGCES